jgi:hypothetical protein
MALTSAIWVGKHKEFWTPVSVRRKKYGRDKPCRKRERNNYQITVG